MKIFCACKQYFLLRLTAQDYLGQIHKFHPVQGGCCMMQDLGKAFFRDLQTPKAVKATLENMNCSPSFIVSKCPLLIHDGVVCTI